MRKIQPVVGLSLLGQLGWIPASQLTSVPLCIASPWGSQEFDSNSAVSRTRPVSASYFTSPGFALTTQQSAKEPLGCTLIAARLPQNINDITILIDGTPKILLLAIDSDEEFVQIPSITEASLFLFKTSGIVVSEFPAPLADGLVRNDYSTFGQKIFYITEAQTKAMVDPYGVADDFRRETVSSVTGSGAIHEMSLSVGCPS
jgi:hypothetical protein